MDSPIAGSPVLGGSWRADTRGPNRAREWEMDAAAPIWLPGQRTALGGTVDAAVLEAERETYATELAALRAAGTAVDAAMAREPFDPSALREALAAWSARWAAFNAVFTGTMVHAMEAVSPAGRAQIAAARRQGR